EDWSACSKERFAIAMLQAWSRAPESVLGAWLVEVTRHRASAIAALRTPRFSEKTPLVASWVSCWAWWSVVMLTGILRFKAYSARGTLAVSLDSPAAPAQWWIPALL